MLATGEVIYTLVTFPSTTKPKYLVVLNWGDHQVHCLMINSGINPIFGNRLTREFYIHLDKANHPFMEHDNSYIDCNEIHKLPTGDCVLELKSSPTFHKGILSPEVLSLVKEKIETTPMLGPAQKQKFVPMLEKALL